MGPRNQMAFSYLFMAEINGGDPNHWIGSEILQVTTRENTGLDRRSPGLIIRLKEILLSTGGSLKAHD